MVEMEGKSQSAVAKELFLKGLASEMMPYLANLYKEGKISFKKISKITGMHFIEVMDKIAEFIEDIDMDPKTIEYSHKIGKKLLPL